MAASQDLAARSAELCELLARRTGTRAADWHLVFKARYGMREVFRALGQVRGQGQVVTTLCTGCTAADSIISAGMVPAYAALSPATLGIDVAALELAPSTRAVLLQHSYGMVDDAAAQACAAKARAAGAILVEDSAHCLARMARDAQGHPVADVSVHSFGIEKTFSNICFGGAIWVSPDLDEGLRRTIDAAFAALEPLPARIASAATHYRTQTRVLAHLPQGLAGRARGWLVSTGRMEPPVADVERQGQLPYPGYLPSAWVVEQILGAIGGLDADERQRLACAEVYREGLVDVSALHIPEAALTIAASQPLIRFPVVVASEARADALRAALAAEGLYCVAWYKMPFFPGATDLAAYGMSEDDPAYRAYLRDYAGTVGLPTDIPPERIPRAVELVRATLGA